TVGPGGVRGIARDVTDLRVADIQRNRALRAQQIFNNLRVGQSLPEQLDDALARIGELCEARWLILMLENTLDPLRYGWTAPDAARPGEEAAREWAGLLDRRARQELYRRVRERDFCYGTDLHADCGAPAAAPDGAPRPPLAYAAVAAREAGGALHGVLVLARGAADAFNPWDEIPLRLIANQLGNLIAQKYLESQILVQNRELAERSRRATEATHLKSRFLSTISHELRTPLHAIIGFTEVVLRKTPGLPPRRQKNLETVLRNAEHLLTMIGDLLDLSRIEAGKVKILSENFLLAELVQDVATTLRSLASRKRLELRTRLADPGLRVVTDRAKVRQILINLVYNAIKFTHEGMVEIAVESDGHTASIAVRDTGIGIDGAQLPLIFDEFAQAESNQSEEARGGAGLGLTLSRKLARILGGEITAVSRVNEGSTFMLRLPLRIEWGQLSQERGAKAPPLFEVDMFDNEIPWEEIEVDDQPNEV
ncbi:MAG: ATP-binding protein, partial [bacterium]|nr:ATP-binding protein [bacterium]